MIVNEDVPADGATRIAVCLSSVAARYAKFRRGDFVMIRRDRGAGSMQVRLSHYLGHAQIRFPTQNFRLLTESEAAAYRRGEHVQINAPSHRPIAQGVG